MERFAVCRGLDAPISTGKATGNGVKEETFGPKSGDPDYHPGLTTTKSGFRSRVFALKSHHTGFSLGSTVC